MYVLSYLQSAGSDGPVSSEELSRSINASPVCIRRVLTPLRESGLVTSRPGPRGGWVLASPAESITLARVWKLLQGDEPVMGIHGPNPACPVGVGVQRALVAIDADVAGAVEATLARTTVADVLSAEERSAVDATKEDWPR